MDALTALGIGSAALMLVTYALEQRAHWYTLAFSVGCICACVYAFLVGTWVFGALELVWFIVAMRRWMERAVAEQADGQARSGRPRIQLDRS